VWSLRGAPRPVVAGVCLLASALAAGCGGGDDAATPLVVVPNEVLADIVQRVSCVEEVEVVVGDDESTSVPILVLTLDGSPDTDDGGVVLSVPAVTTTIGSPGEPDPWIWLDPIRVAELAQAVSGALASSGRFDPALLDRCIARMDAQMEQLDGELFAATQEISDADRVIDVSLPGTVYFASRYGFFVDDTDAAAEAGRMISADGLDGAASYDDMMRLNTERLVEMLRSP